MNKLESISGFGNGVESSTVRQEVAQLNDEVLREAFAAVTNETLEKVSKYLEEHGVPHLDMLNNVSDREQLFTRIQELTNATEWSQQQAALDEIVKLINDEAEQMAAA